MADRSTKAEVHYTDHGSRAEHCSICAHFATPDRCELVEGKISQHGWCSLFEKWSRGGSRKAA